VAFLAHSAWQDRSIGHWPDGLHGARNQYSLPQIKKNLGIFVYRFFRPASSSAPACPMPPRSAAGGSLSPRGDWRAPSDGEATVWMQDLERIPDLEA
jgi:NAD+ synthase (glutamine-hydrolysing)